MSADRLDAASPARTPHRVERAAIAQQGIESVEVSGRLLQALAGAPAPMMLRDLAAAADMAPAKAHRYLVSLARLGLVEQHPTTSRYDIGTFAIQLGLAGLGRLDPLRIATEAIEQLRDALGQTVAIAVLGNRGPTIVRWLESGAPVSASLRTGAVMPLTRSATGRAFLAFANADSLSELLEAELAENRRLGLAPTTRVEAEALAADSRAHKLARVRGELSAGVHSVSAPVFDADGRMALAVTSLGYQATFDAGWNGSPAMAVRACADDIGRRLGAGRR